MFQAVEVNVAEYCSNLGNAEASIELGLDLAICSYDSTRSLRQSGK